MKSILLLILLGFGFSSQVKAADCGPVTRISIVGDHDTDWVAGANIKLEAHWVRVTSTNSPELTSDLTDLAVFNDNEDTKGFFICLDEYETYTRNRQKFASVSKYRIWKDGKFILKSSQ